jgi:hypothetical protein
MLGCQRVHILVTQVKPAFVTVGLLGKTHLSFFSIQGGRTTVPPCGLHQGKRGPRRLALPPLTTFSLAAVLALGQT